MADQQWKELYKKQLTQKNNASARRTARHDYGELEAEPRQKLNTTERLPGTDAARFRRIIMMIWVVITGSQIALWLVISLATGHFTEPWWLWTAGSSAIVGVIIWFILNNMQRGRKTGRNTHGNA